MGLEKALTPAPGAAAHHGVQPLTPGEQAHLQDDQRASQAPGHAPGRRVAAHSDAPAKPAIPEGAHVTRIEAGNAPLVLPASTSVEQITASGSDLAITLPDGQVYLVVNGAIDVPELIIGNVRVPRANIAALLTGQEPAPAAGAPQSSGGNFAQDPSDIAPAFGLGNLLAPTDLAFGQPDQQVLTPGEQIDNSVSVTIVTPDQPAGAIDATATVAESGMPARGSLPAGSDSAADSETVSGTILVDARDAPVVITIDGMVVSAVGDTVQTRYGELTITSLTATEIGYTYTLLGNSTDPVASETLTIAVTDADGDVGTATLTIALNDDAPTARADAADVPPANFTPVTGNVITGANTATGSAGADTQGADGASVSGVRSGDDGPLGTAGQEVIGQYGVLVIAANGEFSYVRAAGTPGGVEDVFTYQLTDGDGDVSSATLRFTIADSPVAIISVPDGETTVDEAGLAARPGETAGSDAAAPSETTEGTILFDAPDGPAIVTLNGEDVYAVGQIIETASGRLVITAIGDGAISYAFTLADNVAGDFANEEITVTVTDSDGDSDTTSFIIAIADDVPTARNDAATLDSKTATEVSGNVILGAADGTGADTPGADGASVTGIAFADSEAAAGDAISGTYGTLVIAADGSYTYQIDPTNPAVLELAAGQTASDVFTYTLTDGDGDVATASLVITIVGDDNGITITGLAAEGPDGTVNEAGLADGSAPDPGVLETTGEFTVSALDGMASLRVGGTVVFDGTPHAGMVITSGPERLEILSVTPSAGASGTVTDLTIAYRYVLSDNSLLHTGSANSSLPQSFAILATDSDGTTASDTLVIAIVDDVPTARVDGALTLAEDAAPITGNVLGNDTAGADGARLTSVTIDGTVLAVAPSGITTLTTAKGTYSFNASGAWTFAPAATASASGTASGFSYTITDGDGDVSSAAQAIMVTDGRGPRGAAPVTLVLDDQRLADGSTPAASQPEHVSAAITFTPGSDAIASIAFGDTSLLAGQLQWTRDSATSITGRLEGVPVVTLTLAVNGNSAVVTATLLDNYPFHADPEADDLADLGRIAVIATDSDGDAASTTVNIAVSDDVPSVTATPFDAGALTVDESDLATNAKADFSGLLNIHYNADGPLGVMYSLNAGNFSGLIDVATGSGVGFHYGTDGSVIAYVVGAPTLTVFTLSIDDNGVMTLDQMRAVRHPDGSDPNDAVSVVQGAITVTATVIDGDGDQASVEVDLAGVLVFRDDGPRLELTSADTNTAVLTTHDALTIGAASEVATGSFAGLFAVSSAPFGADGPGQITWAYHLVLGSGAASTELTSNGTPITLALVGAAVVASAGGSPIFSIAVDPASGVVTLTQFAELDHPLPGSAANYGDQLLALANDLVLLEGSATIVDRDGDSLTRSLTIDLGGNIRFADDGPSVTVTGTGAMIEADETTLAIDPQKDFSGLFATTLNYGADGAGTVSYALAATSGPTGLFDAATGEAVILSVLGGVIYGKTQSGGAEVFRITVSGAGVVTFDQSRAVLHTPDSGPDQVLVMPAANHITLTATVIDGDGDSASAAADITDRFAIRDDAPHAVADVDTVARDGNLVADGNVLLGVGGVDANDTDGNADSLSTDGATKVTGLRFGTSEGVLGSPLAGAHGTLSIDSNGFYRYAVDALDPAVIALSASATLSEVFTYTIEDRDGDRSSATITITIAGTNDLPIAKADTNWILDGASGSDPAVSGNVLATLPHPGAPVGTFSDIADVDPDADPLTVANPDIYFGTYGTLVLAADGTYTYYLNEDHAAVNALGVGQSLSETFSYTATDGALSASSTLTITIFGTNDAPVVGSATARISEEGLTGANADDAPSALLDTTNSPSASGTITISDPDTASGLMVTLGSPGAVLTVGGQPVTWSGVGTATLSGSVGGQPVITISITNSGSYTVTLAHGVDHPAAGLEDVLSFAVPVLVSDGTVTTTNPTALTVTIEDDAPVALGESGSSTQPQQNVNTLFILDFSASIDDGELNTMITAVKAALNQLDAATVQTLGVKFVIFSASAFASPSFASAADANAWLSGINPADGGIRPDYIGQNTNYSAAIQTALANFSAVSGANNQVVFISDGNPNQSVQFAGTPPNVSVVNSLTPAVSAAWNTFVDSNNIGVTAIGVANDPINMIELQRLADVDLNDAPNNQPILITDFGSLMSTLIGVVVPPSFSGDLDANDFYGADGGRLLSIVVGTVTYTWDGAGSVAVSSGGTIAGSTINAATPLGGTLHLDFATGHYDYQPPSPITATASEVFAYTLVDSDGDTASANLTVTLNVSAPPVALDLDGDGLEFATTAAGAHFDFNADGQAEATAWIGKDDGLLALDANGDGKVSDRSEIVFARDGLTDLQGLAADYDSNHDGVLDAKDAAFAKFGVWQDANGDGVADPGEFTTLAARGIVSIDLSGSGRSYQAAEGEVLVHSESSFTLASGASAKLADVSFLTGLAPLQPREAGAAPLGMAMLAAGLIASAQQAAAAPTETAPMPPPIAVPDSPAPAEAPATPAAEEDAASPSASVLEPAAHSAAEHSATTSSSEASEPALDHAQVESHPTAQPVFADLLAPAVEFDTQAPTAHDSAGKAGFAAAPAEAGAALAAQIVADALAPEAAEAQVDSLITALTRSDAHDLTDPGALGTPLQAAPSAFAALLEAPGTDFGLGGSAPIDWSAAHQVLTDQHIAVQLETMAAGHG